MTTNPKTCWHVDVLVREAGEVVATSGHVVFAVSRDEACEEIRDRYSRPGGYAEIFPGRTFSIQAWRSCF